MPNHEHLAVLRKGREAWNEWRKSNPSIIPDLSTIDLSQFQCEGGLAGADFSNAQLQGAKMFNMFLGGSYAAPKDYKKGCNFENADLTRADMRRAQLSGCSFRNATMIEADLRESNIGGVLLLSDDIIPGADFSSVHAEKTKFTMTRAISALFSNAFCDDADFSSSYLSWASFSKAHIENACFEQALLHGTDFQGATLTGSVLEFATLTRANVADAILYGCRMYGCSVWDLCGTPSSQRGLIISAHDESTITVENLEVGQFIHLLLSNERIRHVIDTITSKVVLILGRFTDERKHVLDSLRDTLRERDYTPVLFDFEKPANRTLTETIRTLAHMSRFVIADITDAKSIPQELLAIVPDMPSVPVQPIIHTNDREYGMFEHFKNYPWVLDVHVYEDEDTLIEELEDKVISPAERRLIDARGK